MALQSNREHLNTRNAKPIAIILFRMLRLAIFSHIAHYLTQNNLRVDNSHTIEQIWH